MKKSIRRESMATPLGMIQWETDVGLGPTEAAGKLSVPLRTYFRWRSEGMPKRLQREIVLDRMEAMLGKKHGKP